MSLRAFRRDTLAKVRQVGRRLPPDGDWTAMLLLDTPSSYDIIPLAGMDGHEALPTVSALIVEQKAIRAARIQMANQRHALTGEDMGEIVQVFIADASTLEVWRAYVTRHAAAPPELGPWEKLERVQGPFADTLVAAMAAAAARN